MQEVILVFLSLLTIALIGNASIEGGIRLLFKTFDKFKWAQRVDIWTSLILGIIAGYFATKKGFAIFPEQKLYFVAVLLSATTLCYFIIKIFFRKN